VMVPIGNGEELTIKLAWTWSFHYVTYDFLLI
jgi:hypothetical protein